MIDQTTELQSFKSHSKMDIVTRQLSSFIRKRPTKEGAEKLATFSMECDLSFSDTLLTAATKYFKEAFSQWSKYQAELEEHVTTFMKYYQHKIELSGLQFKINEFKDIKNAYQKVTKKRIPQLSTDELKKIDSFCKGADEQAHLYAKNKKKELQLAIQQEKETADQIMTETKEQTHNQLVFKPRSSICSSNSDQVRWKQLFAKINLQHSLEYQQFCSLIAKGIKNDKNNQLIKKYQYLDEHMTNNRDCAFCLRFFREGQDLAYPTYRQGVSFFGPLSKCSFMQTQLTEHIVSYLNSGGGVILIGCKKGPCEEVYPNIEQLSQKQKESIENKLVSYLSSIYPSVAPKRQIDFSFIPVKNDSGWMKGVYLLRLAVYPNEHHQTYFFNDSHCPHFACQTHFGVCKITKEDVYHFMCQQFHKYNPQTMPNLPFLKEKGNVLPTVVFHSSTCFFPQKGEQLYIGGGGGILGQEEEQNRQQQPKNPLMRPGFKFITLLVASKQVLSDIKEVFNDQEKCQALIEPAFPAKKYALSNSTWLIWHNVKFDRLSNGIKKYGTKLKAKNSKILPILISTLNSIVFQLDRLLQPNEIAQFQKLALEYAHQKVQHRVIDGHDYFKCQSIITAVLLYFHQTNRKQKSVKFMKIPNGINSAKKPQTKHEPYEPEKQEQYRSNISYGGMIPQAPKIPTMPQVIYCYCGQNQDYYQYYNNGWMSVKYSDGSFGQRPIDANQYLWLQQLGHHSYSQY